VGNFEDFIHTLDTIQVSQNNFLTSCDLISVFTRMPIVDTLDLLSWQFVEDIRLLHHILISLFSCFNSPFYIQMDGVIMGSQLSLVIAFFMENFEEVALSSAAYKLICCFHYVDDIFMFWTHVPDKLSYFLNHLSCIHSNIQFTMET
jgi:hypothetical protein